MLISGIEGGVWAILIGMNPSSNEMPNINLPPAPAEQTVSQNVGEKPSVQSPEQAPGVAEQAPRAAIAAMPVSSPIPPPTSSTQPLAAQNDDVVSTTKSVKAGLIEDSDLIEKEWVDKAKRIVERTREDPHQQSELITEVRADYMKKHYNKTIKTSK